jgi:NADH:ubiquinone oxidoreductase subunit E
MLPNLDWRLPPARGPASLELPVADAVAFCNRLDGIDLQSVHKRSAKLMKSPDHPEHPDIPDITEAMWQKIDQIIDANKSIAGSVIGVLRECQNVVGYLPVELIDYISYGLNLSRSEVFGVASFYALFSFVPKGRHTVKVCMGTACYVKGIKEVLNRIENHYQVTQGATSADRRFSLEAVRCLGACGLAPVMVVDQDTYGAIRADRVIDTLEQYD